MCRNSEIVFVVWYSFRLSLMSDLFLFSPMSLCRRVVRF